MNARYWRLTQGVVSYGLNLFERLERGQSPDLEREQSILKDLLLFDEVAPGDDFADPAGGSGLALRPAGPSGRFLGVRYALVCWLDELFTTRSAWSRQWNEHKLEAELYNTNDRAWRFWEQAKFAQSHPTTDALEVYYLCVCLGFRGALLEEPEKLGAWLAAARQRLGQVTQPDWKFQGERAPAVAAPPLTAAGQLRQLALTAWVALLVLAPLTAFFVIGRLSP
jgi:type VI secretion system protein ImpK